MRCMPVSMSRPSGLRFVAFVDEDQAGDVVEQTGAAQAVEGLAQVLVAAAGFHEAIEQFQQDELFAGASDIGAVGLALGSKPKKSHGS